MGLTIVDDSDAWDEEDRAAAEKAKKLSWTVPSDFAAIRLDKALSRAFPQMSRTRLQVLLHRGLVQADGAMISDPSRPVKPGQTFDVIVPQADEADLRPQAIGLDIVYEDADLLVINKPPGMVVHPAAGNPNGTLVNALLAHCGPSLSGVGGVRRPGIVHRLDKDTSGLMVAAKTDAAHMGLARQFEDRTLRRTYLAVVEGVPAPASGAIDAPIGRDPRDRKRMAVVHHGGKNSLTMYRIVRIYGGSVALLECRLATGRTHQIRVHLAHIGHPVVGDPLYGKTRVNRRREPADHSVRPLLARFARQALHARNLTFVHPRSQSALTFHAPPPADLQDLIDGLEAALGGSGKH